MLTDETFAADPGDDEAEETGDVQDDGRRAGATDGADEADEDESSEEESEVSGRRDEGGAAADSTTPGRDSHS